MIVPFPGALTAQLSQVGGKGQSLIRMTQLGLPVPPGFILTVEFFQDWLDLIKLSDEWKRFITAEGDELKSCCDALKATAKQLSFSQQQQKAVDEAFASFAEAEMFAVRSSSPAEDLEGSSFAGGYETVLGVKKDNFLDAVRIAFSSSLDYRVLAYKNQHGFDIHDPRIAVVVQKQIASTASGVAFSINPLTNDYDEAVFNANFGLGESVVSGVCTPDTIVVDKVAMRVRERVLGAKEERIMLNAEGGTTTISDDDAAKEFAVSDGHVLSLTRYIKTLEEVFRKPVDVEWALEGDNEYILQARPVTSFLPLPPSVVTPPGHKRRLYWDVSLSVQAFEKPMSTMATSVIRKMLSEWPRRLIGIEYANPDLNRGIVAATDGRIYAIISHLMSVFGKEKIVSLLQVVDPIAAQALDEIDIGIYSNRSPWIYLLPAKALPRILDSMPKVLFARTFPDKAHHEAYIEIERFKIQVRKDAESKDSIPKVAHKVLLRGVDVMRNHIMPGLAAGRWSLERMKKCAEGAAPELIANLELAMPNNITIEMGLALYDMAEQLPPDGGSDDMQDQTLSPEFMERWQDFIEKFGHRGPKELDISSPRNRDEASLLFEQIRTLRRSSTESNNPLDRYEKNKQLREKSYREICSYLEKTDEKKLKRFQFLYKCWEVFGGYRELPKYCLIYAIDALRTRLLVEAQKLVRKKRLESVEQVFDLTLEDFEKRVPDSKTDLVELAEYNRRIADKLRAVPQLPALIDSRGRIIRPTRPAATEDGATVGTPISSGVARGPIKVLHSPDEKPLNYGDILVARATDPGWTPLFVNAAAVVLEVGGLLQHGALVAREYGLPCVGGVAGATRLWEDGTIVEVDGSRGVIRVVEEAKAMSNTKG